MENKQNEKKGFFEKYGVYLIIAFGIFILFNQWQISSLTNTKTSVASVNINTNSIGNANIAQIDISKYLPKGIPAVYGAELTVSYDDPVNGMDILNQYDDLQSGSRGSKAIALNSEMQKRYVKITNSIGCEYCCGAPTLTSTSGEPACSCAHSGAMRGLAKYLLQKHANEYTDEQILDELVKWKTLFFPQQMIAKLSGASGSTSGGAIPSQVGGC